MFIYLIEIEWPEVKNFNDPGEGARGAVSKEHNLQTAGEEGAVKKILFQESLERAHNGTSLRFGKQKLEFCGTNTTQLIVGKKPASSPIHNLLFAGKLGRTEVE